MTDDALLDLIRQDMRRGEDEMRRLLAIELFKSDPFYAALSVRPIPWWRPISWRVRGYLSTRWQALCGHDLSPAEDDD